MTLTVLAVWAGVNVLFVAAAWLHATIRHHRRGGAR